MHPSLATQQGIHFSLLVIGQCRARKGEQSILTSTVLFMAGADVLMDSTGFLTLWDTSDKHHAAALRLQKELAAKHRTFFTTDYIIGETLTLLLVRHSVSAAADFLGTVERSKALRIEWIGPDRFYAALTLFRKYCNQEWSFTVCTSFATMRDLGTRDAFSTDRRFEQAGLVPLLLT